MTDERTAPVLYGHGFKGPSGPLRLPWSVAERAYSVYSSRYGTGQSLETLCERGGFYAEELDELAPGWREEAGEIMKLREQLKDERSAGREEVIQWIADQAELFRRTSEHGPVLGAALEGMVLIARGMK